MLRIIPFVAVGLVVAAVVLVVVLDVVVVVVGGDVDQVDDIQTKSFFHQLVSDQSECPSAVSAFLHFLSGSTCLMFLLQ